LNCETDFYFICIFLVRSIEISLIILSLTMLSIIPYYIVNLNIDLDEVAKRLKVELESVKGFKVVDIGVPVMVEIQNGYLKVEYNGRFSKVKLNVESIDSVDFGPIIKIYSDGFNVWLGLNDPFMWIPLKINYTLYGKIYYKSYIEGCCFICEDGFKLEGGFKISKNSYGKVCFNATLTFKPSLEYRCFKLTVKHGDSTVWIYGRCFLYMVRISSSWGYSATFITHKKFTLNLECINGTIHVEGDDHRGGLGEADGKVTFILFQYRMPVELKVHKIWGYSLMECWSSPVKLDLKLIGNSLTSTFNPAENTLKIGFSAKPNKLIMDGKIFSRFNFNGGWWITNITSIGLGTVYFDVDLVEVYGKTLNGIFEFEINVHPGVLAVIIPGNLTPILVTHTDGRLYPVRAYGYGLKKTVYEFIVNESGEVKLILNS